jgi:hypothetical protein
MVPGPEIHGMSFWAKITVGAKSNTTIQGKRRSHRSLRFEIPCFIAASLWQIAPYESAKILSLIALQLMSLKLCGIPEFRCYMQGTYRQTPMPRYVLNLKCLERRVIEMSRLGS